MEPSTRQFISSKTVPAPRPKELTHCAWTPFTLLYMTRCPLLTPFSPSNIYIPNQMSSNLAPRSPHQFSHCVTAHGRKPSPRGLATSPMILRFRTEPIACQAWMPANPNCKACRCQVCTSEQALGSPHHGTRGRFQKHLVLTTWPRRSGGWRSEDLRCARRCTSSEPGPGRAHSLMNHLSRPWRLTKTSPASRPR